MTKRKIAVYGSLRKGEYNYNYFQMRYPEMTYTGTHKVDGFDLFSLGAYPAAVMGDGELVVDTFDVDLDCFSSINRMEIGAAYYAHTVDIDGEPHTIWLQQHGNEKRKVESGDWSKYLQGKDVFN